MQKRLSWRNLKSFFYNATIFFKNGDLCLVIRKKTFFIKYKQSPGERVRRIFWEEIKHKISLKLEHVADYSATCIYSLNAKIIVTILNLEKLFR